MKVLAVTLLAFVCATSGVALAGKKAKDSTKKECTAAAKKSGKCASSTVNVSTTVAAPSSVRSGSMENPSSRSPASVIENNVH